MQHSEEDIKRYPNSSEIICEQSEKSPLLINRNIQIIKLKYPKWLLFPVVITIPFLHMFSYILSLSAIGQYTYVYFLEEKYPGVPHSLSGSLSSCSVNTSSVAYLIESDIQQIAAKWGIYCNLAFIVPSTLLTINLATYSDVHGRKLFFIVPLTGSILKNIICGVGFYYNINVRYLLIVYMIEACTGSWIATLSMSFCFIADTTTPGKWRSTLIALLDGAVGLGAIAATLSSGYLITWTNGYFYPQMISVGIAMAGLFFVLAMVQETLPVSRRRADVSILQNMQRVFECYQPNFSPHGKRWMFIVLIFMFGMSAITTLSRSTVDSLYVISSPFCWQSIQIGLYSGIRTILWNVGGVIMIVLLHLCTTDEVIALIGCVTSTTSLVIQGLANTSMMMYISACCSIGCIVTMPMVRSIMSRMTPPEKQGSIFAGVGAVETFSSLIGTVIIGIVYDATVDIYRGLTFLIWAGFGGIGIVLSLLLIIRRPDSKVINTPIRQQ